MSDIRIHTNTFTLRQIADNIEYGGILLASAFQRAEKWSAQQESLLIESILLGIPLPPFYFKELDTGNYQIVDGLQRLRAIYSYLKDEYAMGDVEYFTDQAGKTFSGLFWVLQQRVYGAHVLVHTLHPQTTSEVCFDVFKRINSARLGEP